MTFVANPGSGGSTFGSDTENTSEQWPIAKMTWGAAGSGQRVALAAALPVQPGTGATWTASQSLGTAATRWYAQLSDGTNSPAIKAASTAVAATDPSLSVGLHPSSPLPTGSNTIGAVNIAAAQTLATVTTVGTVSAITAGPAQASGFFSRITDGTTTVPVKTTGTPAATTDAALTVTLSPNLPVATQSFVNSAASTNATSVKASAGTVYSITASNTGAAAAYVKFYNLATAPTVGTSVPVFTMSIPASGTVTIAPAMVGIRFSTGIALAITNLAADTDTTAVLAAQVKVATSYI